MAGNDIRARLLKQRGVLASQMVKLSFGEVEVREIDADRLDILDELIKREDDKLAPMRLYVAESVHVDGELLINKAFMDEAGEFDKNILVKETFKQGDVIKAYNVLNKLMGFGDAEEEVEELKN